MAGKKDLKPQELEAYETLKSKGFKMSVNADFYGQATYVTAKHTSGVFKYEFREPYGDFAFHMNLLIKAGKDWRTILYPDRGWAKEITPDSDHDAILEKVKAFTIEADEYENARRKEMEDKIRLREAAPELLEALERINFTSGQPGWQEDDTVEKIANEAIKKAKGL